MILVVADSETTGMEPPEAKIIEIAFHAFDISGGDLSSIGTYASLINPLCAVPPNISGVTAITTEMVKEAPSFENVLLDVRSSMAEDAPGPVIFVAHNASFDLKFLRPFFSISAVCCTLRAARLVWPDAPDHKLNTLKYMLDLPVPHDAHRAMADVETTVLLLQAMMEKTALNAQDFVEWVNQPREVAIMPFGKHKGSPLKDLPKGYVAWLLGNADNMDADLRSSLERL